MVETETSSLSRPWQALIFKFEDQVMLEVRDWTGLSDGDCKTDAERKERHEWLEQRFLKAQEAGARAEADRQERLKQARRDRKRVDADGYEFNPELEHDHRAFPCQLSAEEILILEQRWENLAASYWDYAVRLNFQFEAQHGRFANTGELKKLLTTLKQRRPEFYDLPCEIGGKIAWEVSRAFSGFLKSDRPEASLLQRRRQYCYYLKHIRVVGDCLGGMLFQVPKLGRILCEITQRPTQDFAKYEGESFADMLRWGTVRIKGGKLWKSPTTEQWYLTLSFERKEPMTTYTFARDNHNAVLDVVYAIFTMENAKALTQKELIPALATQNIHVTTQSLKQIMKWCGVTLKRPKRRGKQVRGYSFTEIAAAYQRKHPAPPAAAPPPPPPAPIEVPVPDETAWNLTDEELEDRREAEQEEELAMRRKYNPLTAEQLAHCSAECSNTQSGLPRHSNVLRRPWRPIGPMITSLAARDPWWPGCRAAKRS